MHSPTPTIVLVHGAFTDASSWAGVISLLQAAKSVVRVPANPLRGLAQDAAYIRSVVHDIDVPVVLVGHDYGGAVITHVMSVAQRPIAQSALTSRSGPPAWASKPSWYAIASAGRLLSPTAQRFMAQRMAATEYVLDASHAVALSQPDAMVAMIREAAEQSTGRGSGDELRHLF
ncbi:alpha/beta fold hydrolase [Streptomyces yaanensis]|uniref:Alpha/beta fold hydrolase n=1 Tax=Streptomyces yaanensis TaxID=1142239 RepID=A0ABV7S5N1_9ACTN|nr:alpha/beta fold hydrolase [Streptomyces sp. CGMCC 4.7035]WNB99941.1 alpha/beta fold hydrolase [Streptomyces sp. CGMCC 4.7035]